MKNIKLVFILIPLFLITTFSGCNKEATENKSVIVSIPTGVSDNVFLSYYTLDNSGKFLFLFIRDLIYNNTTILKVNLSNFAVENKKIMEGVNAVGYDNILVTDNNELISTFWHRSLKRQLTIKMDENLNFTKVDTGAYSAYGNNGRTRLIKTGPNRITGLYGNKDYDTANWYMRYQVMDENLNIISQVLDTTSFYGPEVLSVNSFIKTSDGGSIFCAYEYIENMGQILSTITEKRDANFNLLWRKRFATSDVPQSITEQNGKYYVYVRGSKLFTLIYDINGNLIDNKPINVDGANIVNEYEPMRKLTNGELLLPLRLMYNNMPYTKNGALIKLNESGDVISFQNFGGKKMLGAGLININASQSLLFHWDNNFTPDGANQPRLVFRYIDENGSLINE